MLGSGMCIMSRYPIVDIHYNPFRLNGYLHMLFHGDWFGGKGIGVCRINVEGFIVDVFTTHVNYFLYISCGVNISSIIHLIIF